MQSITLPNVAERRWIGLSMRERDARQGEGKRGINAQTRMKRREAQQEQEGGTIASIRIPAPGKESTAECTTTSTEGRKDITFEVKCNPAVHAEAGVKPT